MTVLIGWFYLDFRPISNSIQIHFQIIQTPAFPGPEVTTDGDSDCSWDLNAIRVRPFTTPNYSMLPWLHVSFWTVPFCKPSNLLISKFTDISPTLAVIRMLANDLGWQWSMWKLSHVAKCPRLAMIQMANDLIPPQPNLNHLGDWRSTLEKGLDCQLKNTSHLPLEVPIYGDHKFAAKQIS